MRQASELYLLRSLSFAIIRRRKNRLLALTRAAHNLVTGISHDYQNPESLFNSITRKPKVRRG